MLAWVWVSINVTCWVSGPARKLAILSAPNDQHISLRLAIMPLREKLNDYKGRFKEGTRRIFGSDTSLGQSTDSSPNVQVDSPSTNPGPVTLSESGFIKSMKRAVSAPPRDRATELDSTWRCFKGFLQILDKGSGVFAPLKLVMDDLVQCFGLHEVS